MLGTSSFSSLQKDPCTLVLVAAYGGAVSDFSPYTHSVFTSSGVDVISDPDYGSVIGAVDVIKLYTDPKGGILVRLRESVEFGVWYTAVVYTDLGSSSSSKVMFRVGTNTSYFEVKREFTDIAVVSVVDGSAVCEATYDFNQTLTVYSFKISPDQRRLYYYCGSGFRNTTVSALYKDCFPINLEQDALSYVHILSVWDLSSMTVVSSVYQETKLAFFLLYKGRLL